MVSPGYLPFHPNPKKPDSMLPVNSVDAHCHVFGPATRFPFASSSTYQPVDAPKDILYQRHSFLGIEKAVIVQASCHGTDNAAMVDALMTGRDNYRGIAVVEDSISEAELTEMDRAGVRGVRFNFVKRLGGGGKSTSFYRQILAKIRPLGWHCVVYFESEDLESLLPFLESIELPVVIDHMGRVPVEEGLDSKAWRQLCSMIEDNDKYWVKISCPERLSKMGPPYTDVDTVANGLLELIPDRVLWGTDWPHPNMKSHMPDDGQLVDRILSICHDKTLRDKVLVKNPHRLYWPEIQLS